MIDLNQRPKITLVSIPTLSSYCFTCLWHGSPSAPLDDIESTLEINYSFFLCFFNYLFWSTREEMEFVDDKGEVATASRRHHHHRSLPPPPSPSLPSPIARYHHHNHHLSHPQSLFTTTIASQIRLHHRHARHNHHCSLLCLSLYVSGGAYRTKRDDSAKTMS